MSQTTAPTAPERDQTMTAALADVNHVAAKIRDLEDDLAAAREKRARAVVAANKKGATQAALAAASGVSQPIINKILADFGLTTPRN